MLPIETLKRIPGQLSKGLRHRKPEQPVRFATEEPSLYQTLRHWWRQEPTDVAKDIYNYLAQQPDTLKLVANRYFNPQSTDQNRK